jgi:hypothetical protein
MGNWAHPHQPWDMICVKDWEKRTTSTQLDRSPSSDISNSHAVKVAGITPRTHHSQIKKAAAPTDPNDWQVLHDLANPLKLRFQRTSQQPAIT